MICNDGCATSFSNDTMTNDTMLVLRSPLSMTKGSSKGQGSVQI